MVLRLSVLVAVFLPLAEAVAVTCDGTEILCLDLTDHASTAASGPVAIVGDFDARGFMPYNQGGIDWAFDEAYGLQSGRIAFDVEGLQPIDAPELGGGKVSLFSWCGEAPHDNEYIGFQKMPPDYRDGHILRYGQDDDGLADNWDAVIITGANFGCFYSIDNADWGPDDTHHVVAEWDPSGLHMEIDGFVPCTSGSNGDAFDPVDKRLVLGNRCEHHNSQQAIARFRNLRVWDWGTPPGTGDTGDPGDTGEPVDPCAEPITVPVFSPTDGSGAGAVFQVTYDHCDGAQAFRVVQLWVGDAVDVSVPHLHAGYGEGAFGLDGQSCVAGEDRVLASSWGALDCARARVSVSGTSMTVDFPLVFDTDAFAGSRGLFVDAKGGDGDPEPRLGWTHIGAFQVTDAPDPTDTGSPDVTDDDTLPEGFAPEGCGCGAPPGPSPLTWTVLLLAALVRRHRLEVIQ